ncbi:MAG: endonuclease/exonuclease/phosphatase family protein [Actinomycetota bacterium]|nr:endonuclease/exonuclease/phosphatase family protein [Actinomycetota bacterium]MDQ3680026.1 endonuclease/exonuclease/phosphatase family protein [Actinomycetota bacterium]
MSRPAPGRPGNGPIRIVTFNIQHGRVAAHAQPRRRVLRVDTGALARYCAGLDADVLAMQEVDVRVLRSVWADQALAVARATGLERAFGEARRVGVGGRYGNALLAGHRLEEVEVVALPRQGRGEPRAAVLALASVGQRRLSIAATHLSTERGEALVQLDAVLDALAERPEPRVLLGDLNLVPTDVGPRVEAAGLVLADTAEPTHPASLPRIRIDHIAVGGLAVTDVAVLPSAPVSDHRALRAQVR